MSEYGIAISKVMGLLGGMGDDECARAVRAINAAFPVTGNVTSGAHVTPGALRQRRHRALRQALPVTASDVTGDASVSSLALLGGEGGGSLLSGSSLDLSDPSEQISNETGSTAGESPPAKRSNASALVTAFAGGVNGPTGGTWAEPRGKPFSDLADALQLHVVQNEREALISMPLILCRNLGARWTTYCEGLPKSAFAARDWLGEGAPERKPNPAETERQTTLRRNREAAAREKARKEDEGRRGPPPPHVAAAMRELGKAVGT